MFKIKKLSKIAAHLMLGLLAIPVSINCYAGFAKDNATAFMVYNVELSYPSLTQVSTLNQFFYEGFGNCPADDRYKLNLPKNSVFREVTNKGCVAIAIYRSTDLPGPLKGVTIGMAPTYIEATKRWSFDHLIYATDLLSLPGKEYQPITGSRSTILNMTKYYIGGLFAQNVVTFLQDPSHPEPSKI